MNRRTTLSLALLFAALVLAPSAALAEDIWRLAGTFNGWNLNDNTWAMTPVATVTNGSKGVFEITRSIDPGQYQFKFVKNGTWDAGHYGGLPSAGPQALTTPGDDIVLDIRAKGTYRIELNEQTARWLLRVAQIDKPVIVPHTLGQFVLDRPFILDISESVFDSDAKDAAWTCTVINGKAQMAEVQGNPWQRRIIPQEAGPLALAIHLTASKATADAEFKTTIAPKPAPEATDPKASPMVYRPAPTAARAWTVDVVGDFNNWGNPSVPGGESSVLHLASNVDGSFTGAIVLPDGAYRYQFLVNNIERVRDAANPKFTRTDDGQVCSVLFVGKTAADFGQVQRDNINTEGIRHDPSRLSDFRPISKDLGLFDVSVLALPGDAQYAYVLVNAAPGVIGDGDPATVEATNGSNAPAHRKLMVHMHRQADYSGFERWTARIMTGINSGEVAYSFGFKDGSSEFITKDYHARINPALDLPAWAMGAVWYQIFPERFRNGNPLNDPYGPGITLMPWTADWYTIGDAEAAAWRKRANVPDGTQVPSSNGNPLYTVVWDRRYGGDLQGIVDKLDYIKSLGTTAIYLNPIFQAESMHKYDATDYRHIDQNFGTPKEAGKVPERWTRIVSETEDPKTWTWTPADRYFVDTFIPAVHKKGMKVILDGVFNHTGRPFWAFDDIEKNGEKSPYKDWYYVNFDSTGKLKSWTSWYNTGALPKFHQTDNGDLVPPVKQHIFNITKRWMDPNGDGDPSDGIDGWRLDVALDVGLPFWRDWRKQVKSINPNAFITAEIWTDASQYLTGDTFDTHMHYPFARAIVDWLSAPGSTTPQLIGKLSTAFDDAPQTNLIHQNLFCSHDTDRFVSMLFNPGREYDQKNRVQDGDGRNYKAGKPTPDCYRLSLLGLAIQSTYLGAPMVYYGDEVGMYGADDPSDRKPFPWTDLGSMSPPSDNADPEILKQYTKWLNLRNDPQLGPILRYGSLRNLNSQSDSVFAYTRELNGRRIVTVVNRSDKPFDAAKLLPANTPEATVPALDARYWALDENGID